MYAEEGPSTGHHIQLLLGTSPPLGFHEIPVISVFTEVEPFEAEEGDRVSREKVCGVTVKKDFADECNQVLPLSGDTLSLKCPGREFSGRAHTTVFPYKSVVAGIGWGDQSSPLNRHSQLPKLTSIGNRDKMFGDRAQEMNVPEPEGPKDGTGGRIPTSPFFSQICKASERCA